MNSQMISVIIVIISITIIIASLMFSTNYQDNRTYCNAGSCPTDIKTGEKRCPSNNNTLTKYNPKYEVCNSRNSCDNSITPFAVLSNGETDIYGICDVEECSCSITKRCPQWSAVAFRDNTINIEQYIFEDNRIPPSGYTCYLPISSIGTFRCPVVDISNPQIITNEILTCASLYDWCGEQPLCEKGYLAIIKDKLASRYMCVTQTSCSCNQATIIDPKTGTIECQDL